MWDNVWNVLLLNIKAGKKERKEKEQKGQEGRNGTVKLLYFPRHLNASLEVPGTVLSITGL